MAHNIRELECSVGSYFCDNRVAKESQKHFVREGHSYIFGSLVSMLCYGNSSGGTLVATVHHVGNGNKVSGSR
jgi:hypothetical protein